MSSKLMDFYCLKKMYPEDPIFTQVFKDVSNGIRNDGLGIELLYLIQSLMVSYLNKRGYVYSSS